MSVHDLLQATRALTAALRQKNRILRLHFPGNDAPADAVMLANRLDAEEGLSREFRFTVEVIADRPDIPLKDVLGKNITVELQREDGSKRFFNGYAFGFRWTRNNGGFAFYQLELGPWTRFLRYRQDCYIWHNQTVEQQIASIFGDYPQADWRTRHLSGDAPMTDAVQFQESDANYVARRLESLGWHGHFEHRLDGHTLVISGDSTHADPIDGGAVVHWEGDRPAAVLACAPGGQHRIRRLQLRLQEPSSGACQRAHDQPARRHPATAGVRVHRGLRLQGWR